MPESLQKIFIWFYSKVRKVVISFLRLIIPKPWQRVYISLRRDKPIIDRSEVVIFSSKGLIYPDLDHYLLTGNDLQIKTKKVSLITTCLNEEQHIDVWLNSLINQIRLPDELVIVDGGSSDRTLEIINQSAGKIPFPIKILEYPGANIAKGRNIAINNATYDLIACTDVGSELSPEWLSNLIVPFEVDPLVKVSFGYSCSADVENYYAKFFLMPVEKIKPQSHLPSSRNLAFYKSVWEKIDGYPEWLKDAGEDTYFDVMLKKEPIRFAFSTEAVVKWYGPKSIQKVLRTVRRYSFGDGEAGIFISTYLRKIERNLILLVILFSIGLIGLLLILWGYWRLVLLFLILMLTIIITISILRRRNLLHILKDNFTIRAISLYQSIGYVFGVANRSKANKRYSELLKSKLNSILYKYENIKGIIIYLPTHDWNFMFQRPQQMARAFAREGYLYFYCTNNERTDFVSTFSEVEERLILCHVPLETFNQLISPIVYVGAPYLKPLLDYFDHPFVIYDHYDDIVVSSSKIEDHVHLLRTANLVIATSDRLIDIDKNLRPDVLQIPNGVDYEYIERIRLSTISPPEDIVELISKKRTIIGYSGAIANWFDYDLLRETAHLRPNYEFVLIGVNYDKSLDESNILTIPNIHWLGIKKYEEIFSYILKFDVAIIPFKVNNITLATSPIKLFEYAACHKPIISSPLPECIKYSQVQIANNPAEFAAALDISLEKINSTVYIQELDAMARGNSWTQRVQTIDNRIKQFKGESGLEDRFQR